MEKVFWYISNLWSNKTTRNKVLITLWLLVLYRLLVIIPVPFANVNVLMDQVSHVAEWLWFFVMLLGGTLENFSIIAVWLSPFINASIIMQLLTIVVPKFEELQELGEQWQRQLQQYMRRLTFPLAFLQSIGMVYLINSMLPGVINITGGIFSLPVLGSAFVMAIASMILLFLADYITEKGMSNGTSLIIFAGIVSGIVTKVRWSTIGATETIDLLWIILFMVVVVAILVWLSVFLLKSVKQIPIIYARQGKVEQTSSLPIPLNPVWMVPIIFALAFATFPYLLAQLIIKIWTPNQTILNIAKWVDVHLNIYSGWDNVWWIAIIIYFILVVLFTFFYTLIQFNPDKIADTIQKRWWFIPTVRPGNETATYIHKILMHLCLWWWLWLAFLACYTYLLNKIPVFQDIAMTLGWLPVVVTWSGVIIIVWVVQDLINKAQTDVLMEKYSTIR